MDKIYKKVLSGLPFFRGLPFFHRFNPKLTSTDFDLNGQYKKGNFVFCNFTTNLLFFYNGARETRGYNK